jgi:DNA-binding transcriptional regulator YiaG
MRHAMKTQQHQITLDGVTFEGDLPFYVSETRPELGPLTRDEDLRRFNRTVVRKIAELGLQGPESLRFCRKVAGLGVVEFATLLGYDRKAVQRWESGEVAVPRLAMAFASTIAQGHEQARETLKMLNAFVDEHERPTTVHVDAA